MSMVFTFPPSFDVQTQGLILPRFLRPFKGYLHRRENNKYLSLTLAMAILKRWEIFY
jgi:hypothetical protein